ncbi:MAG TPA: Na/Pi cotransporter family protein [Arenibaculum sp.]|nr:Na/Pi cotransporter family protein [Arenibaculum sp.]
MTSLLVDLAAGIALLLWSLRMVRTGIQRAYGGELRRLLAAGTGNRASAFAAGLGVAALLQSSTATSLMAASFVGRGLLPVATGLAILLGADVGTTLAAQLLSLDIRWLGTAFLVTGLAAFQWAKGTRLRDLGRVAVGIGLLMLAMRMIVGASEPLRTAPWLDDVMAVLASEPVLAVLLGTLLAWLAHSSLTVVLLTVSLAGTGVVPVSFALAFVVGANLGSSLPALALTAAETPAARRLPLANLIFRAVGAALAIGALPWILPLVPGADATRQVVNFHTAFNLALAVLFIGWTGPMARLCARLLPDQPVAGQPGVPRYLDRSATAMPAVALACAAREALRMGDIAADMLHKSLIVLRDDDRKLLGEVERTDDVVDRLNEAVKLYLAEVSRDGMDEAQSRRCQEILTFATNIEHIGDIIDRNLMELAGKKIRNRLCFSQPGIEDITELHARVEANLQLAFAVFLSGDVDAARRLIAEKDEFRYLERSAAQNHLERLRSGRVESIETSSLHLDVLRDLKRIHAHIASAAYPILEAAGELNRSRLRAAGQPAPTGFGRTMADTGG